VGQGRTNPQTSNDSLLKEGGWLRVAKNPRGFDLTVKKRVVTLDESQEGNPLKTHADPDLDYGQALAFRWAGCNFFL
jgi:hypothetical protein